MEANGFFLRANRDINRLETPEGQITLLGLFVPLLIETLLRNLMGTVSVVHPLAVFG